MSDITDGMQRLVRLEEVVDKGVRNMLDAADALKDIRDEKLYKQRGYDNFDSYLSDEWGFGRSYINKIIKSSETRKRLGTIVPELDTSNLAESAIRELNTVPDEQLEDVIDLARSTAKAEGKRLTTKVLKDARDEVTAPKTLDLPQEKIDQSYRLALTSVDSLRRHLGILGMLDRYDKTLMQIRGGLRG